jgi:phage tail-like protein
MSFYYPPTGFFFRVQVLDLPPESSAQEGENDVAFQDASGLSVEMQTEDVVEGGLNRYRHRLPTAAKFGDLVLKRGYVYRSLPLFKWCAATLQGGFQQKIAPKTITLQLLRSSLSVARKPANDETFTDKEGKSGTAKEDILRTWSFSGAWPTKWELSDFGAMKSEVVIETLHFAYREFTQE